MIVHAVHHPRKGLIRRYIKLSGSIFLTEYLNGDLLVAGDDANIFIFSAR